MKRDLYAQLGMVKASSYRRKVLTALKEGPLCPKEISAKVGYPASHVSSTLSRLSREKLTVCKNPDARKGRLYRLTPDGEAVCAELSRCDV